VAEWAIIGHLGRFGRIGDISVRYLKPVLNKHRNLVDGQYHPREKNIFCRSTVRDSADNLLVESERMAFASPAALAKVASVMKTRYRSFWPNTPNNSRKKNLVWDCCYNFNLC